MRKCLAGTGEGVGPGFAITGGEVGVAGFVEFGVFGMLLSNLVEGESLQMTKGAFAQAFVDLNVVELFERVDEVFAGVVRPSEVGGVDGIELEAVRSKACTKGFCLFDPVVGEGGVL